MQASTVLDGSRAGLARLGPWLDAAVAGHDLPGALTFALRLCLEEAATNIVVHGLPPGAADRRIRLCIAFAADAVTAEIEDAGPPFDPAAAPLPDAGSGLADAPAGGRGLRLLRGFADGLSYERSEGRNRLAMTFRRV